QEKLERSQSLGSTFLGQLPRLLLSSAGWEGCQSPQRSAVRNKTRTDRCSVAAACRLEATTAVRAGAPPAKAGLACRRRRTTRGSRRQRSSAPEAVRSRQSKDVVERF